MQSRKDFLRNSGITFAGILLSNQLSAFTSSTGKTNAAYKITIGSKHANVNGLINKLKSSHEIIFDDTKAAFLHNLRCKETGSKEVVINTESYSIVQQGAMKIGIVTVTNKLEMKKTDALASQLKNDYGCTLVVCVSNLGFKNKNKIDDITLANNSTFIDTIISSKKDNYCSYQYVAKNKNKYDVYIVNNINDGQPENSFVALELDRKGNRQAVAFC